MSGKNDISEQPSKALGLSFGAGPYILRGKGTKFCAETQKRPPPKRAPPSPFFSSPIFIRFFLSNSPIFPILPKPNNLKNQKP